MSKSGARYRRNLVSGASSLSSAFSFIAKSASTYRWVVFMLSCPSHSAMMLKGTPDCSKCIAVVWRKVWGDFFWGGGLGNCAAARETKERGGGEPFQGSIPPRWGLGNKAPSPH